MEKIKSFLKKLYQMRIRISRKGTPVLNWSVLFSALCVLFAPHMSIVGAAAALLLGYEFSFDAGGAGFSADNLEKTIRDAAAGLKTTVTGAAQAVRTEIGRAAAKNAAEEKESAPSEKAAAEIPSEAPAEASSGIPAEVSSETPSWIPAEVPAGKAAGSADGVPSVSLDKMNRDMVKDLERRAEDLPDGPALGAYRTVYSSMAGSVPTLQFPDEKPENGSSSGRAGAEA